MSNPPDQLSIPGLIREGLRKLRAGKVSAALKHWDDALEREPGHPIAESYRDYIKKNRIRIAVHLGRIKPNDDEPIEVPESWPAPPEGLWDPIGADDAEEAAPADTPAGGGDAGGRLSAKSSGELPYAEIELTGASQPRLSDMLTSEPAEAAPADPPAGPKRQPSAPRLEAVTEEEAKTATSRSPSAEEYAALEIVLEDDSEPDAKTLPPLPDQPAAAEVSDPSADADDEEEQIADILFDKHKSQRLEKISLDHLTGPAPSSTAAEPQTTDAPRRSPGTGELPMTPRVATTFDEVAPNPLADAKAFEAKKGSAPDGPSPYATLAGLGPRVMFAEFGDQEQGGEPPPLDFAPPPGEDVLPSDQPLPADARPTRKVDKSGIRAMPAEPAVADAYANGMDAQAAAAGPPAVAEDPLLNPDVVLARARALYETGEHTASLDLLDQLQERYPTLGGVHDLVEDNKRELQSDYLQQLGDLSYIPVPKTEVLGADDKNLDPKAAYLFSRIDGTLSLQDVMDVSGMSEYESSRLLLLLKKLGLLVFEAPR